MKRAVVVGASSSLGKEIAERLNTSTLVAWNVALVDANAVGQVTAAGDEPTVIASLDDASFDGADVVFFAGDRETTETTWKRAVAANAAIVDATRALAAKAHVVRGVPGFDTAKPDLTTLAMVPVRPGSWLLAALARAVGCRRMVATVLHPASEFGDPAMDELHAQTVALLSFQAQPRELFDAQVAFAVREEFGPDAKVDLKAERAAMEDEVHFLLGESTTLAMSLIAAPVFHGLTASVWMGTAETLSEQDATDRLCAAGFETTNASDPDAEVSNQSVTQHDAPMVRIRVTDDGLWAWVAMDNLRWTAATAESCAMALLALRPDALLQ